MFKEMSKRSMSLLPSPICLNHWRPTSYFIHCVKGYSFGISWLV